MNPMTNVFDFNKNFEQLSKMAPEFAGPGAMKAFSDMQAKYREVAIEALQQNVELTAAWMKDAAKDAASLLSTDAQPAAYAKKAGEIAQAAMQDMPARMLAYAEIARNAQTQLMNTAVGLTPKTQDDAAEVAAKASRTSRKTA